MKFKMSLADRLFGLKTDVNQLGFQSQSNVTSGGLAKKRVTIEEKYRLKLCKNLALNWSKPNMHE